MSGTGSDKVARNVATTLVAQVLSWIVSFAVILYLPTYLGPDGMGKLGFATSVAAVLTAIIPLGTSMVLVKEIARDHARARDLLTSSFLLRIPIGIVGALLAYGLSAVGNVEPQTRVVVAVCAAGAIIAALNEALVAALTGLEMLGRQNLVALIEKLIWAALTIAAVMMHGSLWLIAGVGWVSSAMALVMNATKFRSEPTPARSSPPLPKREGEELVAQANTVTKIKSLAAMGLPFLGWTLFTTLYGQTDPMIIRFVTGRDADVGWYSVGQRLVGTVLFLPTAVCAAVLPALARLKNESRDEFRNLAHRAVHILVLVGVPIGLILVAVPDRIIDIMPFRHGFHESIPVLRIAGVGVILWYLGMMLGAMVFARDDQHQMFRTSVAATVIGIPLCAICSYYTLQHGGNGAIGAMASDVILELFLVVCYLRLLPKSFDSGNIIFLAKCLVAAIPMSLFFTGRAASFFGIWSILPALATYGLMCVVLRCVGAQDIRALRGLIARKT